MSPGGAAPARGRAGSGARAAPPGAGQAVPRPRGGGGKSSRDGSGGWGFDAGVARRHLVAADPRLGEVMRSVGAFRLAIERLHRPYESLAEAIVYQQISGHAAAAILARVCGAFASRRFPPPPRVLAAPEATLRAAGLSRPKIAAIRDLAQRTLDGTVPTLAALRRMDDEEIVGRLTAVRGIGRWTVEMLLIFKLGRPDVLPVHDYGIRTGFRRAFGTRGLPTPARVARRGERWRPYRTMASWYLWRANTL